MNEHAKKIYQAALDGKNIQFDYQMYGWLDADPFRSTMHPIDYPILWRIKPEPKIRYYRVLLDANNNDLYPTIITSNCKSALEYTAKLHCQTSNFRRWLTDWIPYEVEVED
jgi:hypothetical protein